jgi:Mn2+/Fe2+ NRAMP family transporter
MIDEIVEEKTKLNPRDLVAISPCIILFIWALTRLFVSYPDYGQTLNFVMAIIALLIIFAVFAFLANARGIAIKEEEEK